MMWRFPKSWAYPEVPHDVDTVDTSHLGSGPHSSRLSHRDTLFVMRG